MALALRPVSAQTALVTITASGAIRGRNHCARDERSLSPPEQAKNLPNERGDGAWSPLPRLELSVGATMLRAPQSGSASRLEDGRLRARRSRCLQPALAAAVLGLLWGSLWRRGSNCPGSIVGRGLESGFLIWNHVTWDSTSGEPKRVERGGTLKGDFGRRNGSTSGSTRATSTQCA